MRTLLVGLLCLSWLFSADLFARGDDAGNGGFTDRRGKELLQRATNSLDTLIRETDYFEVNDILPRRALLLGTLKYDNLILKPAVFGDRYGRPLMLDYMVNEKRIIIYRDFFISFAATAASQFNHAVEEVKLLLLHESAHLWGADNIEAREFALDFLEYTSDSTTPAPLPVRARDVEINRDHCGCLNGKPITDGNCQSYCARYSDEQETLYARVQIGDIARAQGFNSLSEWCYKSVADYDLSAQCFLRVQSETEQADLPVVINSNSDELSVNLFSLNWNTTYIAKLIVVSETGLVGESYSFQFRKRREVEPTLPQGVLKIEQMNRYKCLLTYNGHMDDTYDNVSIYNYLYPSSEEPPVIPFGDDQNGRYICHDQQTYGDRDSVVYPRYGLQENEFSLWSKNDLRFYETMEEGRLDIDVLVEQRLKNEYNITTTVNLFTPFDWMIYPLYNPFITMGYMMNSWRNEQGRSFCPGESDYYSDTPLFRVLKEFIGVPTEGLYVAKRGPEYLQDPSGNTFETPEDKIIIQESLLKKIGFYLITRGGQRVAIEANENDFHMRQIFFYWPVVYDVNGEPDSPFTMRSHQKIYKLVRTVSSKSIDMLQGGVIPSSDKRIGCIPTIIQDTPTIPGGSIGQTCESDYHCDSLCCNADSGRCQVHDPEQRVYCQKPYGQSCVSSAYCASSNITQCFVVETGSSCTLRCYNIKKQGDCTSGLCVPPDSPAQPVFDPANPDCSHAMTPQEVDDYLSRSKILEAILNFNN